MEWILIGGLGLINGMKFGLGLIGLMNVWNFGVI
jgi:hypothetical protein